MARLANIVLWVVGLLACSAVAHAEQQVGLTAGVAASSSGVVVEGARSHNDFVWSWLRLFGRLGVVEASVGTGLTQIFEPENRGACNPEYCLTVVERELLVRDLSVAARVPVYESDWLTLMPRLDFVFPLSKGSREQGLIVGLYWGLEARAVSERSLVKVWAHVRKDVHEARVPLATSADTRVHGVWRHSIIAGLFTSVGAGWTHRWGYYSPQILLSDFSVGSLERPESDVLAASGAVGWRERAGDVWLEVSAGASFASSSPKFEAWPVRWMPYRERSFGLALSVTTDGEDLW